MSAIITFSNLVGLYVLTPDGQLGFYDQDKIFVQDSKLTKAFSEYNLRFLMAYLQNPEQGNFRLAIVYRTKKDNPWGPDTLLLEKHIVRRLYPVTGTTASEDLTAFQKNNRKKSIYRGMELFLEYKDASSPELPVYCPVLYDRITALNSYAAILDRQMTAADRETPVVEIVNLLAAIPMAKRFAPEIRILKETLHQGIVKKSMRKSSEFTLIEDIRRNRHTTKRRLTDDPYGQVDKRADRQVTLDALAESSPGKSDIADDSTSAKNIGLSLDGRPMPADPLMLKSFTKFCDLDHKKLEAIAAQSLLYSVPSGTKLLERGTNDAWNLYLLEGTLQLIAADGVTKFIDGGTDNARNPISTLKPRMYAISALTRVAFLWIDDNLVEQIVQGKTTVKRLDGTA